MINKAAAKNRFGIQGKPHGAFEPHEIEAALKLKDQMDLLVFARIVKIE